MAIPTRTDAASHSSSSQPLRRWPIVLARLPHVGADSRLGHFEPGRVIAEPIEVPENDESSHFVDRQHSATHHKSQSEARKSHRHSHDRRRRERAERRPEDPVAQNGQSSGLAEGLYQIHSQITPYASAIVAAALLACAGLLYWVILSPARPPGEYPGLNPGDVGLNSVELPKFEPRIKPDSAKENETREDLPSWDLNQAAVESSQSEVQDTQPEAQGAQILPDASEESGLAVEKVEQPVVAESEQAVAATTEPLFPTTSRPTALDFAKLVAKPAGASEAESSGLDKTPEMASRPVPQVLTPPLR